MKCPFLEEIIVRYCKVCSIKKMIPKSSLHSKTSCTSDYSKCPLFQEITRPSKNGNKECIWMKQKLVSSRICNNDFNCGDCEFDQMVLDRNGKYEEHPELIKAKKKFK